MKLKLVTNVWERTLFLDYGRTLYKGNTCYRRSAEELPALLAGGRNVFGKHALIKLYLIEDKGNIVGRFALINDKKNPAMLMLAFFEAQAGLPHVGEAIASEACSIFPQAEILVAGLDGHLNYGAGYLLGPYDTVPAYGLAYSMPYYPSYFDGFTENKLFTFSFPVCDTGTRFDMLLQRYPDISVVPADMIMFREEIFKYTALNNACFKSHIYWTEREAEDDFELFYPFRHLITGENLLFAMHEGKPIGFLLWFPDFNEMVDSEKVIKAATRDSADVLRLKHRNVVKRVRLAEIAVLPEYQNKCADLFLLKAMFDSAVAKGFTHCEGGFISASNKSSMNLAMRYIERITGQKAEICRTYAMYEKKLK